MSKTDTMPLPVFNKVQTHAEATTTYDKQKLGLIMTTSIANQILRAHRRIKTRPAAADDPMRIGSFLLDDAC